MVHGLKHLSIELPAGAVLAAAVARLHVIAKYLKDSSFSIFSTAARTTMFNIIELSGTLPTLANSSRSYSFHSPLSLNDRTSPAIFLLMRPFRPIASGLALPHPSGRSSDP